MIRPRVHFLLSPFPRLDRRLRFLLALAPLAAVLFVQPNLPATLRQTPAALHYPVVFFAAWLGGLYPGLLAVLVCWAVSLFLYRPHLIHAPLADGPGLVRSFMFFYTSVLFTLLVAGLQRALKRAEEAILARDEFLSLASHELKTPLSGLMLQAQLRTRRLDQGQVFESEELKRMARYDHAQLERLNRLIDNMLDVSRIDIGKLLPRPVPTDLAPLLSGAVSRFREQLSSAANITLETPPEFWATVDPLLIEQVCANLLNNCAKYAPGKPVSITLKSEPGWIRLTVADQGPGIPAGEQARIFGKFARAEAARGQGGLGLGLYLSREIVEQHGGTISLESRPGHGASFTVSLPLGAPEPSQPT